MARKWIIEETREVRKVKPGEWYLFEGRPMQWQYKDVLTCIEYPILSVKEINEVA